jgi:hypothetical protein
MKRSFVAMAATAMLLVPNLATACSVCFTGRADETRVAFIVTTGLLTALPVLLIGSVIWWLRRRAQQIHDEQE